MGISKINHNFSNFMTNFHCTRHTNDDCQEYHTYTIHMYNTLPAVKKVSDCRLTLSEPVPKRGLSVEALESRRTNIGVTRINVLFTTYCI